MKSLTIYLGKKAKAQLATSGISPDDVGAFLGASGGPKWFVLSGLDRVIFPEFLSQRTQPIQTIGSSSGAWRVSCFAQSDPVAAVDRLAEVYSEQVYSEHPTTQEVTEYSKQMLSYVIPDEERQVILNHPLIRTNMILAKAKGPMRSDKRGLQLLGLAMGALSNIVHRKGLSCAFDRVLFHCPGPRPSFHTLDDYPTEFAELSESNIREVTYASGAIPLLLEAARTIQQHGQTYYDGGIIDYHFDAPFARVSDKLVLYPHFFPKILPGWFDRMLPWRKPQTSQFDNVVMLVPSPAFVESLPFRKIPDRKDFQKMDNQTRLTYWKRVIEESERLIEPFMAWLEHPDDSTTFDIRDINVISNR
ncbi:patatin-like phospholipase domain-containing protein [Algicola sagamiensis]|uniref:hypothetical protein n=1 Tax=Algicola sagamiensis TaxID=163869 RepID=UPI00036BF75A|nr:hypothetical protein [Algicola sagamiensis]